MKPQERTRRILKSSLEPSQRLILIAIADHMEDTAEGPDRNSRPSVALLSEETGLSERAVQGHIKALEQAGILSRHRLSAKQAPHCVIHWSALPVSAPPQNRHPAESSPPQNLHPAESAPSSPAESAPEVDHSQADHPQKTPLPPTGAERAKTEQEHSHAGPHAAPGSLGRAPADAAPAAPTHPKATTEAQKATPEIGRELIQRLQRAGVPVETVTTALVATLREALGERGVVELREVLGQSHLTLADETPDDSLWVLLSPGAESVIGKLRRGGVRTVAELTQRTADQLRYGLRLGETPTATIVAALGRRGIALPRRIGDGPSQRPPEPEPDLEPELLTPPPGFSPAEWRQALAGQSARGRWELAAMVGHPAARQREESHAN